MKHRIRFALLVLLVQVLPHADAVAQWKQLNGPGGGSIAAFGRIGRRVLAATNSRVFASTDGGHHWSPSDSGVVGNWIGCFTVAGSSIFGGADSGVYESLDSGASWSMISSDPRLLNVNAIVLLGSELFVSCAQNGVFRSLDHGLTWSSVSQGLRYRDGMTCLAVSDTTLFAGSDSAIFRSSDHGNSWTTTTPSSFNNITALAVSQSDIFAIRGDGLLHSTNNGNTWDSTVAPPDTIGFSQLKGFRALVADDTSLLVASKGGGLYKLSRSEQWGVSYLGLFMQYTDVVTPTDSGLLIGRDYRGVYRSGRTVREWPQSNDGLTSGFERCVAVGDFGILTAGAGWSHFARSTDDGLHWVPSDSGLPPDGIPEIGVGIIGSIIPQGQSIYACTDDGLYRSRDSGVSWSSLTSELIYHSAYGFAQVDTTLFFCTYDGLYRSTDDGLTWQLTGLSNKSIGTFTPIGPYLFAGGTETGLYRSSDAGATWKTVNTGLTNLEIMCMTSVGPHLFLGTYDGLFRSDDNGDHWANISANYGFDTTIETMAVIGSTVFVGTVARGVYVSTDFGSSWKSMNEGMGMTSHGKERSIFNLAVRGKELYAATWGAGIWKRDATDRSVPITSNSGEAATIALRALPQPSVGRTSFTLTSTRRQHVEVVITNILGSEVSTLYSGDLDAGDHTFNWDAAALSSGSYLCVARTASGETKTLSIPFVH
ncbi:MAG: hypothetical protein JSS75_13200 [Bacteroidetes bacterium]|nr:hypothetical protein [Bacteroidota bacterium]